MDTNEQQITNPLMQRIQLPGETFALPSGGIFYEDGVLDSSSTNAEIHVHPMTTIDEIVLKTPDMLFSGDAVRQVFKRCIPQILNVDKMLSKDVDYLLVCLRKVSYGTDLTVEYTHNCKNATSHKYTIDISGFISHAKKIDPTTLQANFSVIMPNGQVVKMKPIGFKDFVSVMQSSNLAEEDINPEKIKTSLMNSLSGIIVNVDEVKDPVMIREWLEGVPPSFIKAINKKVETTLDWGSSFTVKKTCSDCNKEISIDTPMNPLSFFS